MNFTWVKKKKKNQPLRKMCNIISMEFSNWSSPRLRCGASLVTVCFPPLFFTVQKVIPPELRTNSALFGFIPRKYLSLLLFLARTDPLDIVFSFAPPLQISAVGRRSPPLADLRPQHHDAAWLLYATGSDAWLVAHTLSSNRASVHNTRARGLLLPDGISSTFTAEDGGKIFYPKEFIVWVYVIIGINKHN